MSMMSIRTATPKDREAIRLVEEHAFGQQTEAGLVDALVESGDTVLELVAEEDGHVVGHILFSRLYVENGVRHPAVALAPLAVEPSFHGTGIGGALVREAHLRLKRSGETLAIVLGEPAYYGRFGYAHGRAAGFDSDYQCDALQALAWGDAPESGKLVYAPAFSADLAA
ncbi:MAG: N-acetyltransferase [Mesorhizobium sp.]|nr:N-acetyltransferase [Mesorhizobium sp.]MBL8577978.1 N-acetyltransferase [Mesorhizobium sp.]